ncbi:sensor domain-containing diguanylate cyclase [Aliikangiella coralliicola]|uniref:diguanylate cyclase n=1 Tax=Aliikangiella coralliicola TaxID=2592383 RepID=A0A545UCV2_9GAMM|nr:diguanylate cyclase [Aliikangiella coralliicola]TQV87295.1 sensor domain-containing diguanylate cyclase [Aliikangiella coralliicola]
MKVKRIWWVNGVVASLYFILGHGAFSIAVSHQNITSVIFAPEGVSLAFAILYGRRVWIGVFVGQLLLALSTALPLLIALSISLSNSLEVIIAAVIFQKIKISPELNRIHHLVWLLCIVALVLQPFSATFGLLPFWLTNRIAEDQLASAWIYWWYGNSLGQCLVAPLILSWSQFPWKKTFGNSQFGEVFAITLLMSIITLIVFERFPGLKFDHPLSIFAVLFPLFCLGAIRYGMRGATAMSVVTTIIAADSTAKQLGPFTIGSGLDSIVYLNNFIAGATVTGLTIAAIFSERKLLLDKLTELAYTDSLTCIANRRAFMEKAQDEFNRCQRFNDDMSIILIDVDKFKQINDRFGHNVGDKALKSIANLINQSRRSIDTVGRMGGDEFAVIMPKTNSASRQAFLERLIETFEKTAFIVINNTKVKVTVSIGMASFRKEDASVEAIIHRADQRMYQYKNNTAINASA